MAYRYQGERFTLTVTDGLEVEVQPIASDSVYRTAVALAAACFVDGAAITRLVPYFCIEAQPTWQMVDHRGVIPSTPDGMLRLADTLILDIVSLWAEAFVAEPAETAVDKLVAPGALRDELNARLRAVA